MKKIAMISLNWGWHGGATDAALWSTTVQKYGPARGWDAELITMNYRAAPTKNFRNDYPITILPHSPSGFETNKEYLSKFDLIIMWGGGFYNESAERKPVWLKVFEELDVPIIAVLQAVADVKRIPGLVGYRPPDHPKGINPPKYPWMGALMELPHCRGEGFVRDTIAYMAQTYVQEHFGKRPHFMFRHHDLGVPEHFVPHCPDGPWRLVSTTRLSMDKAQQYAIRAVQILEEEDCPVEFELWGDNLGRQLWLLRETFGDDYVSKIYMGKYSHRCLGYIYGRSNATIDLTRFKGKGDCIDGGMQLISMEAMSHGVIPIVPEGWDEAPGQIAVPWEPGKSYSWEKTTRVIADVIKKLAAMPQDEQVGIQYQNWEWLRKNRNPEAMAESLFFFTEKVCL